MGFFALLDKYTGPLGTASFDTALIGLLQTGATGGWSGRAPLLWTIRMAVARLERPVCQLLLLYTENVPIHVVAMLFTVLTGTGVLSIFHTHSQVISTGKG